MTAKSKMGIKVNVHAVLRDTTTGEIKYEEWGSNLVTDKGDEFAAERIYDDTYEIVKGMKLGTGVTAVAKNGAGAGMVTYISGSNELLDATASAATKGAGAGWRTTYECTWIAGDVTDANIEEVCLTNQASFADDTSAVADTIARFRFAATIDKTASDELIVTWLVDFLGS